MRPQNVVDGFLEGFAVAPCSPDALAERLQTVVVVICREAFVDPRARHTDLDEGVPVVAAQNESHNIDAASAWPLSDLDAAVTRPRADVIVRCCNALARGS